MTYPFAYSTVHITKGAKDSPETTWHIVGTHVSEDRGYEYEISDSPGGPPQRVCFRPPVHFAGPIRCHTGGEWLRYER